MDHFNPVCTRSRSRETTPHTPTPPPLYSVLFTTWDALCKAQLLPVPP